MRSGANDRKRKLVRMASVFELADHLVNKPCKTCMVRHVCGIFGKSSFQAHFGPVSSFEVNCAGPEAEPVFVDSRVEFEVLTCGGEFLQKQTEAPNLVNTLSLEMA
jgi:hypothetical protein